MSGAFDADVSGSGSSGPGASVAGVNGIGAGDSAAVAAGTGATASGAAGRTVDASDVGADAAGRASGARRGEPASSATPVIDIDGLSLVFPTADGAVQALSNVDLEIRRGDFVSFIGPSGCGKTTLLRVIADLEQATAGTIEVNGTSPREARLARAYGYVFQAAALYPWRTIAKNVALPLEIMGLERVERERRVRENLELVDLAGFAERHPWQLSGGMQQRASIARALAVEPELLLMDEPFGALDEIVRDRLNEQLLALWRRTGKTVVFVTHSIPEAVYLSTRIVVMSPRPGRIHDVVDSDLPSERDLSIRETPAFLALANRVREGLREGRPESAAAATAR